MSIISKIKSNSLLKTGANYSAISSLSSVCTMAIGFLNMRWLGPELLGLWQSLTVINLYLPLLQLGIQSGLNLELPLALGAKDKQRAERLVKSGLAFAIILAGLFFVLASIAISYMYFQGVSTEILIGAITIAFIAVLSCFRLHFIATYRSANAFNQLTTIYKWEIAVKILLVYAIFRYKYYGLLLFHAGIELVFAIGMYVKAPYRGIKPKLFKEEFVCLLKRGVFMTIFNQIKNVTASAPTLMLLSLGGVVSVGLFNPALTVRSLVNMVPNQIAQFLHPQMGYKYAQTKNARDLWPFFKKITIWMPICLIPVAIIGIVLCPYVISHFFPKYNESIIPICIMIIGFMFSTTFYTRGFLMTIKAYRLVILLELMDMLLFVGLPALLIMSYPDYILIAMSAGLSIGYFISYFLNIFLVKKEIFKNQYNSNNKE